jgi:hypothetical protein
MQTYLQSTCTDTDICDNRDCQQRVKRAPFGRWYITINHAGFNAPANNRDGYASEERARVASLRYLARGIAARSQVEPRPCIACGKPAPVYDGIIRPWHDGSNGEPDCSVRGGEIARANRAVRIIA